MTAPLVHPETPRVAVACGCTLGESALWDDRTGTVLWVDINAPAIWRHRPADSRTTCLPVDEPVGFVALTADPGTVIAGLKSGLARVRLDDGEVDRLAGGALDAPSQRVNDGHVGPDGAIFYGTMDEAEAGASGGLRRWSAGVSREFLGGLVVPNGPAIDPERRLLYSVDTQGGTILAHDLDESGEPGPPRPLIRFEPGWGHPDGLTVDAAGHLWSCHFGGSRITRFTPEGQIERVLPVPTAQVTKCAFGGPDMTRLYITTAARGRDPHLDPMAGHLFTVETGIRGLAAFPALL